MLSKTQYQFTFCVCIASQLVPQFTVQIAFSAIENSPVCLVFMAPSPFAGKSPSAFTTCCRVMTADDHLAGHIPAVRCHRAGRRAWPCYHTFIWPRQTQVNKVPSPSLPGGCPAQAERVNGSGARRPITAGAGSDVIERPEKTAGTLGSTGKGEQADCF